jgi:hypothetical protein
LVVAYATGLGRVVTGDNAGGDKDPEFVAITAIVGALKPLDDEARQRVLDYALRRLGLKVVDAHGETLPPAGGITLPPALPDQPGAGTVRDIRTLGQQKQPKTAIEMAALVGYYLAHLAPESDRKVDITAADVTKYFHDANFPLPGSPSMTLVHARNAGYFDAGSSKGSYKLNPVGHNLVAHRLPASALPGSRPRVRRPASPKAKAGSRTRKSR